MGKLDIITIELLWKMDTWMKIGASDILSTEMIYGRFKLTSMVIDAIDDK